MEVISTSRPIQDVAESHGIGSYTLWNWLVKYREKNGGAAIHLAAPERVRLEELERESRQLRAEIELLKKAIGYFER